MNEIEYANTDLELWSKEDLSSIAIELGNRISVMHNGFFSDKSYLLSFEVTDAPNDPDKAIKLLCDMYSKLSASARITWKRCYKKSLVIGYRSGYGQRGMEHSISHKNLTKVTEVGLGLGICVYPIMNEINT